ncbi:MAG: metallophosphoesterase [Chitinispirillales bacterium]|jgi:hypothetical protein|nr:metallophosphoesterase [Chitinispirillales bacterium]
MEKTPNWQWIYTYSYAPNQIWEIWRDAIPIEDWISGEVLRVVSQVNNDRKKDDIVFALMTDTHFNVNGTWDDTLQCLRLLQEKISFDGLIHLGDFSDGMVSAETTRKYIKNVFDGVNGLKIPVYACLGNHDSNYFQNNPEHLSETEQCDIYLNGRKPHYYIDCNEQKLRFIFLDSFNHSEKLRYGYSVECIEFLEKSLSEIDDNFCAVIFSHLPPLVKLQFWSNALRGEKELMTALRGHSDKILCFINGHNHADLLYNEEKFPIISLANAKCEAFLERKPKEFITPKRELGARTQECFDIMTINTGKREIRFTRFGSGNDKTVKGGKAVWL